MADQCYHNGDFWQCIVATSDSPTTSPAKWSKIQIPRDWRNLLASLTYAHLLELDGQTDKAIVEFSRARATLDDKVRGAANMEGWRLRPAVEVP